MTPEGIVKAQANAALKALQVSHGNLWWFMPVAGRFGVAGIPDIVGTYAGRTFAFEIKAEKGKATALQLRTLAAIQVAGGIAEVIKPCPGMTIADQVHAALIYKGGY